MAAFFCEVSPLRMVAMAWRTTSGDMTSGEAIVGVELHQQWKGLQG